MSRESFLAVGKIGLVTDVPDYQLAAGAWTRAENMRFKEQSAWKVHGYSNIYEPPSVPPHFLMPAQYGTSRWWVYAGLEKAYGVLNGVHYNLTRQSGGVDEDYTSSISQRWNGSILNSVVLLNNGVDPPQFWRPNTATRFADLTNWPADYLARVIRSYKNYLIALNVTKSDGTNYPTMVKWSHPADPGAIPVSWDETDETLDAGETSLSDTTDEVIDLLKLGDIGIIYKAETVWAMSFIGGVNVFRFAPLFQDFGLLAQRCVCEVSNRRHFVVTQEDIVLHNGQQWQSLADGRIRRRLFQELNAAYYFNSFVIRYPLMKEVWFCYPYNGSEVPTRVLIWNENDGTFAFRDIPAIREGGTGFLPSSEAIETWETVPDTGWNLDTEVWGGNSFLAAVDRGFLLPMPDENHLVTIDRSFQSDGASFEAILERTAMRFEGDNAAALNSTQTVKQITAVYPNVESSPTAAPIYVTLGGANAPNEAVTWGTPKAFVPGTGVRVDTADQPSYKLPAIRFSSDGDDWWKLSSFDVDVQVVGSF